MHQNDRRRPDSLRLERFFRLLGQCRDPAKLGRPSPGRSRQGQILVKSTAVVRVLCMTIATHLTHYVSLAKPDMRNPTLLLSLRESGELEAPDR